MRGEARYQMRDENILVWLPSPMGDAVLCTPALRAIRRCFESSRIAFFARPIVREVLSPCPFNDVWLERQSSNPFTVAKVIRDHKFTHAILFKNSFASALSVFLAGIPLRTGYAREGRGFLLTDKLYPPKLPDGGFKPISMVDYYLAIASWLGAETTDRSLELLIEPACAEKLKTRLPEVFDSKGPVVVLVPGGAFGPSKCWSSDRFAQTADWLISRYNATVVVSVSPNLFEKQIAGEICDLSGHKLVSLADIPISVGELKSLFSVAELVISNDTGPRHIAIALGRKVVSLFGPNAPAWTDTGCGNEIQLVGDVPCAPCRKPVCKKNKHLCMDAITVEMVCEASKKLLEDSRKQAVDVSGQKFTKSSESFFVDADFKAAFDGLGLTSIDAVFSFSAGKNLIKDNLAGYRRRLEFEAGSPPTTVFLKRYDLPPVSVQLGNWLLHRRRISCGLCEYKPAKELADAGINVPKTIAYGQQWEMFFEKRSFIATEKISNAEALERRLPGCFTAAATVENLRLRRNFIARLAAFIKKFHQTGYCHRDLYFSHIFYSDEGEFYLIDLARAFRPALFAERFRVKDIAQVYYSAPAGYFSGTDRLRFYFGLTGRKKLTGEDKIFIGRVIRKAKRMARHNLKYGRKAPFAN